MGLLSFFRHNPKTEEKALNTVSPSTGGWHSILESYAGAWQQGVTLDNTTSLTVPSVFACITLLAGDASKLRLRYMKLSRAGIWVETKSDEFARFLRRPNGYQTRSQFIETWMLCKLITGNVYVLKQRNRQGLVSGLYILDAGRVIPKVTDSGEIFYELKTDNVSGIEREVLVPASEIIHDRFNTMFHPLVGVSPIKAAAAAAAMQHTITNNSANFFANSARPSGTLSAPGAIADDTAARLKEYWKENFTGEKAGSIAVLGDGLKFDAMASTAEDAQLIEQLGWTAETVASVFHIPAYKIGARDLPGTHKSTESANLEYYTSALQRHLEDIEGLLVDGLEMGSGEQLEFDVSGLLRMDAVAQVEALEKATKGGIMAPNEARRKLGLAPVRGGNSPYLQQQNYSLEALAKRDSQLNPFNPDEAKSYGRWITK